MKKILSLFCFFPLLSNAQLGASYMQDNSSLDWKALYADEVRILFPDFLERDARYVARLIKYYSRLVGKSLDTHPNHYPLVLRTQMSIPNGFVTLMPRRSEWFSSQTFTPFIGSLEWYDALAVHEYRHIAQYDFLYRDSVNTGKFLLGELGQLILMNIVTTSWWFEGDAVYTETELTDAGRGRSPRFAARLKALLKYSDFPRYDLWRVGDYTTDLPNIYVIGYFLVTRAYREYGPKIWQKVLKEAAYMSLNPWTLYTSFEEVTGKNFEEFYQETFHELRQKWWGDNLESRKLPSFVRHDYPAKIHGKKVFLKRELDSLWTLMIDEKKVMELNVAPRLSRIHYKELKNNQMQVVWTQQFTHPRFMFQGVSNIHLATVDMNTGEVLKNTQVTKEKRLYHPQLHPKKDLIIATEFDEKNNFNFVIINSSGKVKERISFNDRSALEAVWMGDDLAFLWQFPSGKKQLVLGKDKKELVTEATRNNLYSLFYDQQSESLYMEADRQGQVDILRYQISSRAWSACSAGEIASYRPWVEKSKLYYTSEEYEGVLLGEKKRECNESLKSDFFDYGYLSQTPSDFFHEKEPLKNHAENIAKEEEVPAFVKDVGTDLSEIKVHSWSFLLLGYTFQVQANDVLGQQDLSYISGYDFAGNGSFESATYSLRKFYPVFNFTATQRFRTLLDDNGDDELRNWREDSLALNIEIPHLKQRGVYNHVDQLFLNIEWAKTVDYNLSQLREFNPERRFLISSVEYATSLRKLVPYQGLDSDWAAEWSVAFKAANDLEDREFDASGHQFLTEANFNLPGPVENHVYGLRLSYDLQSVNPTKYRFYNQNDSLFSPFDFGLATGYADVWAPEITLAKFTYLFPVAYPNWSWGQSLAINRIFSQAFYDYALVDFDEAGVDFQEDFRSYGISLFFESLIARRLPLSWGYRYYTMVDKEESAGEFILGLNIGI